MAGANPARKVSALVRAEGKVTKSLVQRAVNEVGFEARKDFEEGLASYLEIRRESRKFVWHLFVNEGSRGWWNQKIVVEPGKAKALVSGRSGLLELHAARVDDWKGLVEWLAEDFEKAKSFKEAEEVFYRWKNRFEGYDGEGW